MYYDNETYLTTAIGNNAINFEQRKKLWSDCILRIPQMIQGTLSDIAIARNSSSRQHCGKAIHSYEYINEKGRLIHNRGLENLVEIDLDTLYDDKRSFDFTSFHSRWQRKNIYIIDNHNHAFYCRYKSYQEWVIHRWSHLIHIDQHSDLNELSLKETVYPVRTAGKQSIIDKDSSLKDVAIYTNEVLDIASFIKPAKEIWLISNYEMILTEYSLLTMKPWDYETMPLIVDIDLDFRAPEMSISEYSKTIVQVRKIITLPQVRCITIATSPTYIDQQKAIEILTDIIS